MPFLIQFSMLAAFVILIGGLTYYGINRKYKLKPGYYESMKKLTLMIEIYREYFNSSLGKKTNNARYKELLKETESY